MQLKTQRPKIISIIYFNFGFCNSVKKKRKLRMLCACFSTGNKCCIKISYYNNSKDSFNEETFFDDKEPERRVFALEHTSKLHLIQKEISLCMQKDILIIISLFSLPLMDAV